MAHAYSAAELGLRSAQKCRAVTPRLGDARQAVEHMCKGGMRLSIAGSHCIRITYSKMLALSTLPAVSYGGPGYEVQPSTWFMPRSAMSGWLG